MVSICFNAKSYQSKQLGQIKKAAGSLVVGGDDLSDLIELLKDGPLGMAAIARMELAAQRVRMPSAEGPVLRGPYMG